MCGIAGVWGGSSEATVNGMLENLRHRGPNSSGIFTDETLSFGMVRLAILDPTESGNQPMYSACGNVVIVYNGEIYNFLDHKESLAAKGYSFSSESDTEVILSLYLHYGIGFLTLLRGMFSLAIYDKRLDNEPQLLLARDPFGIKPLYYSFHDGRLVFASELKALVRSGLIERQIDRAGLVNLLKFGSVPQPNTLLSGVQMLEDGHYMLVNSSGYAINQYTAISATRDSRLTSLNYEEQVQLLEETLRDSVRRQIVSDVPLGAFLSGGVDSSLIVALMSQESSNIKTFSVGFESEGALIDETADAAAIAAHIGTDHHTHVVTGEDFKKCFLDIIRSLDQPSVDGVNSYFVSAIASDTVKVALSGTGGDELFAGYPWFVNMMRFSEMKPKFLANVASMFFSQRMFDQFTIKDNSLGRTIEKYRSTSSFTAKFAREHFIFTTSTIASILKKDYVDESILTKDMGEYFSSIDVLKNSTVLNRITGLCQKGYLRNQLLRDIDVMSMAHSLEVRVPFLDPEVLKVAISLPDDAKIASNTMVNPYSSSYRELGAKKILVDVAKRYLPPDFDLQPKRGFGMPFDFWLKSSLAEIVEEVFSEDCVRKRGLFSESGMANLYRSYLKGDASWAQIWLIVVIEYWCRLNLDIN